MCIHAASVLPFCTLIESVLSNHSCFRSTGEGRPPLPQSLGPGRWSGPPPPRSSNPLPAPGKILSAQLNAAASDPLRHPSLRPPPVPPGLNQSNPIRAPLRQPASVRPLMSVPQGHQPGTSKLILFLKNVLFHFTSYLLCQMNNGLTKAAMERLVNLQIGK